MKIQYGNPPKVLGEFHPTTGEMMNYLYLPVKLAGDFRIAIPKRLWAYEGMIGAAFCDAAKTLSVYDHYIYLTAKTLFVAPGNPGNRPGWHADGYGSNGDLNYIWHDKNPTEFAVQDFTDIPDDDIESMKEMERQVDEMKIRIYDNKSLLRLDETVVHRVGPVVETGVRTFIKISVSRHRYNLVGNSKNYALDYDWKMYGRGDIRNIDNKDFVR